MKVRRLIPLMWWSALLLVSAGCGRDAPFRQESYVFGTRVEVVVVGVPEAQARAGVAAVLLEFDRLHRLLHAWEPSELTALNDAIAQGKPREVPAEVAMLLRDAAAIAARSEGLFNPAAGNLIALWGFQTDVPQVVAPDPAAIKALVGSGPSMADLHFDGNVVRSRNRDVKLDLGGYAKGWALDRGAALLRGEGIANALINIGGNILALGSKHGEPWRVGIQHPRQTVPIASVELRDGEAIGTSGDYQRFFESGGQRFCHIIDPRSGWPATMSQAVTILIGPRNEAPSAGTLSDAGSKPLFIASPTDWPRHALALGVTQALRIDADGTVLATPAMLQRLRFEGDKPSVTTVTLPGDG